MYIYTSKHIQNMYNTTQAITHGIANADNADKGLLVFPWNFFYFNPY